MKCNHIFEHIIIKKLDSQTEKEYMYHQCKKCGFKSVGLLLPLSEKRTEEVISTLNYFKAKRTPEGHIVQHKQIERRGNKLFMRLKRWFKFGR